MDVKGNKINLTLSEIRWAQHAATRTLRSPEVPGLAQKLIDAHVAFLGAEQTPWEVPLVEVQRAVGDLTARMLLQTQLRALHQAAPPGGTDETGQERPLIVVEMDATEKRTLLKLAHIDKQVATEYLHGSEEDAAVTQDFQDDVAMHAATSDYMDPQQAVIFGDTVRDPEFAAMSDAYDQGQYHHQLAVTAAVITALEADLS